MANDPPYRPGTLLADMQIDILASTKRADVTILHDKPLAGLKSLEVDAVSRILWFVFADSRRELGAPLRKVLIPHFGRAPAAGVFLVDAKTKQILSGMTVPVAVIGAAPGEDGGKTGLRGRFKHKS